eukprot:scaffold149423_cov60-Attheya_sp.AAC.2
MGLEVSSVGDVPERKDPEFSFAGETNVAIVTKLPTSNVAPMPQTQEAFKLVVDSLVPDKGTLVIDSSAATTKSNIETVCLTEDKVVPGIAKPNIETISLTAEDKVVPVIASLATSPTPSTTHNVETKPTASDESVEDATK